MPRAGFEFVGADFPSIRDCTHRVLFIVLGFVASIRSGPGHGESDGRIDGRRAVTLPPGRRVMIRNATAGSVVQLRVRLNNE